MENKTNKNINIDQETFSKLNGTQGIQIFNQICRVCLCETNENDQQLDTTIILLQNAHEIKSLIVESTGVQILDLDFLPNHICDTCFNTLKAWYKLRSQTQHSNEVLKKYLKDLTTSSDSNSLPNSDVVPAENFAKIIEDFQTSSLQVKREVLEPVFRCDSCTMAFSNPESLEKHQEEHSEPSIQKSFKCMHCSKSFVFRNSLHNHIQLLHKKRKNMKFQCDLCEKHYNTGTGLKMHKSKPCVSVDLIQQCKIQKMDFDSEEVIAVGEKIISETKVSCIMCKKNFKSNSEFCGHYNQHSNDRKCTICNKHFIEFKHLERHIRMHLRAKVCTCPMCSRLFYSIQSFRFHIKQHAKRKCVYKCNVCQKEFFFVKEFEKHMLKHLEAVENEKKALEQAAKNYLMDVNNMDVKNENESSIWTEENLKNEVTNQMEDTEDIQNRQEQFQIIKVEEDFEENESIKLERDVSFQTETDYCVNKVEADIRGEHEGFHLQSLDNLLKVNATVAKIEESASSSSEDENDDGISKYNEHISEHTKNILEKCKVKCHIADCQTKCFNLYEIWKHFKKEHISEENPYNCCMCNEQFDNNNALRIHIRKYYSFKCPICSKLKPSSGLLKIHVILCHSNDRPYKCTKGYQKFKRLNALKSYDNSHTNKKCTICSKKFSTKAHLKLHINKNNCGRKKKKNVQKSKHSHDGTNIKETKDVNNTDMGHKMESNTSQETYWKNDKTDKNADDISEETKKLLDKCKINCHIAGCETKCSTLPDMWQHFSNEHMSKEKPYKCSICFEEFENKRPLRLHIQKYYTFKCPVCSQLKTSNSALRKHIILIHSNDRPFKCGKCYKTYKRRYALKAHENSHRNIKQFVCSICSKEFTYKYALNIHLRRHRDIKELQCPICRKQFYRRANLKMHIINKNNNCGRKLKKSLKKANIQRTKNVNNIERGYEMESDKSQEVCKTNHMEVDIQVKVENVLEHHIPIKLEQVGPVQIEKHNSKDITDSEKKLQFEDDIPADNQNLQLHNVENQFNPNTTEVTTDISFLKETVLNIESDDISSEEENTDEIDGEVSILSKSNEKVTEETKKLLDKCKINCHIPGCETKCSTVPDIWQHFCNEHISKEKPFKCSICFKEFENKRHLRHHIKTYYSFKCPVCSIVKTSNSSLKRHVKICHSNERPFKCTKCYQKFKRPYALKAHENSHSNEKQFVCGICSKEFAYKNGLNVHLRRHRDIKELQCPICSQQFSTKAYLEMHIINKNINCGDKIKKSLEKPNFQETKNLNNIEKSWENHIPSKSEPDGSFQIEEHHSEFQFQADIAGHHQDLQLHNVKNNQFNTNTTEVTTDTSFLDDTALNIESDNLSPEEGNADEIDGDLSILSQSNEKIIDETKNQTQTNNDQEHFLLVKEEKNSEKNITNKSEKNRSLQIEMDHTLDIVDCKQQFEAIETESQLETTSHGGIACQLQCEDNKLPNANAIDLKIEPSVLKETVTLDNSELGLSSAEEENSDENDDEISTVSKTSNNNQIAKNEPKEIIVKLLENFKLNCHIPGCKTVFQKCLHLNEIWKHFKKQHITERKPYKCCRCSKKFEKKHSLRFHIRKYYSFQCPYCTMLKFTLSELKKHVIQIHSTERSLKCSKCDKTFNRPGALKVHEVTHSDKKQFFCSICPKDFFSKMGLYLHSKSHENIKELQCPTCGKQFPSKNRLKRHTENTSCLREQTSVCLDDEIMNHEMRNYNNGVDILGIENIHNIDTSVEMESSTSNQFYLENSTTTTQMKTNRRNYREQFQLVKEEMDSEIDTANNTEQDMSNQTEMDYCFDIDDSKPQFELIKTESQLQTTSQWVTDHESSKQEHQLQNKGNNLPITNAIELKTDQSVTNNTVHLENPESYETSFEVGTEELLEKSKVNCHVAGCQAKLLSPNDIWEHFRSQHISKNRPYKCSICSEQLDDLREFRKHIRQYYTFRCPVCSKLTPDGSSLKRHVLLWHSNERPFKCSKCPKLSRTYRINKYHEKTHSKNSCGTEESFKNNDVTNVLEIENDMNLQIGNEFDSNILVENDFTNESTNQMKAYVLNGEGQFQLIKTEKDPFIDEIDSNQDYSSCDKEYIEDDNDDATSALSKSNKQINENTKKLLDQCKLNCHVAGCQTKLLNLTDIWNHFKKVHISGRKPFTCSKCSEQFPHLMSFRNHIKKYYSFRCPICFKSRPDYSKLKCHVMLHSNEGTFKCSKCSKLIDSYNNLINHRKTCFGKI